MAFINVVLPRMTLTSRLISGAHRFGGSVFRISLGQHLARLAPVVTSFGELLAAGLAPIAGEDTAILTMNRNARIPKKANHGKRPCSHVRRKRIVRGRGGDNPAMPLPKQKGMDL